VVLQVLKVL